MGNEPDGVLLLVIGLSFSAAIGWALCGIAAWQRREEAKLLREARDEAEQQRIRAECAETDLRTAREIIRLMEESEAMRDKSDGEPTR